MADRLVDLLAGILQAFRHRALAEIQSVVWTPTQVNKFLQSIQVAQHAMHTMEPLWLRHGRIFWMTRQPYLVLLSHRQHVLYKIRDALPRFFGAHRARVSELIRISGLVKVERRVSRPSTTRCGFGPHHAEH